MTVFKVRQLSRYCFSLLYAFRFLFAGDCALIVYDTSLDLYKTLR